MFSRSSQNSAKLDKSCSSSTRPLHEVVHLSTSQLPHLMIHGQFFRWMYPIFQDSLLILNTLQILTTTNLIRDGLNKLWEMQQLSTADVCLYVCLYADKCGRLCQGTVTWPVTKSCHDIVWLWSLPMISPVLGQRL